MITEFLNDIYEIKIVDQSGVFKYHVGQKLGRTGITISRIQWNHNMYNKNGDIRYQIWATNESGEEFAWQTLEKGRETTINVTQNK